MYQNNKGNMGPPGAIGSAGFTSSGESKESGALSGLESYI